jgi:hypothetical protein
MPAAAVGCRACSGRPGRSGCDLGQAASRTGRSDDTGGSQTAVPRARPARLRYGGSCRLPGCHRGSAASCAVGGRELKVTVAPATRPMQSGNPCRRFGFGCWLPRRRFGPRWLGCLGQDPFHKECILSLRPCLAYASAPAAGATAVVGASGHMPVAVRLRFRFGVVDYFADDRVYAVDALSD